MGTPRRSTARLVMAGATVALIGTAVGGALTLAQDDLSGPLRVDFLAYDAGMQAYIDKVKADFNALHPNVELTLEIPNLDTYRDSLTTQASGGAPPALRVALVSPVIELRRHPLDQQQIFRLPERRMRGTKRRSEREIITVEFSQGAFQ